MQSRDTGCWWGRLWLMHAPRESCMGRSLGQWAAAVRSKIRVWIGEGREAGRAWVPVVPGKGATTGLYP